MALGPGKIIKRSLSKETTEFPRLSYHIKYRPQTIDEVVGHEGAVASIKHTFAACSPAGLATAHTYLFSGNKGVGKTTFARIIATYMGCKPYNVIEINGASYTGVNDIRELTKDLEYTAFGDSPIKFIIIDECHRLSPNAWDALLKLTEEPPSHVYWAFCTTEPGKVPETIKSRCLRYHLKDLTDNNIYDILERIVKAEQLDVPDEWLGMIVKESKGSARDAITALEACQGCKTKEQVAEVLQTAATQTVEVITLCRALVDRKLTWQKFQTILGKLRESNPESIRIQICNYLTKAAINQPGPREAERILIVLSRFAQPCNPQTGFTDLLLSIGDLIFEK